MAKNPHTKVMVPELPEPKNEPGTKAVIPGYYTLTKSERAEVDKMLRRWQRLKKNGDNTFEIDL